MKSIIHNGNTCFLCGCNNEHLDTHHIFYGPNRKLSEKYGLTVKLCHMKCHIFGKNAVHNNKKIDNQLKQMAQLEFERTHTREEFIEIFGKNYILEEKNEDISDFLYA